MKLFESWPVGSVSSQDTYLSGQDGVCTTPPYKGNLPNRIILGVPFISDYHLNLFPKTTQITLHLFWLQIYSELQKTYCTNVLFNVMESLYIIS